MPPQQQPGLERKEGIVEEALPGTMFKVRLADQREILAHLSGKMRIHHIRILAGDRVLLDLSPDGRIGRITRRL